jgi:hypothetical protein
MYPDQASANSISVTEDEIFSEEVANVSPRKELSDDEPWELVCPKGIGIPDEPRPHSKRRRRQRKWQKIREWREKINAFILPRIRRQSSRIQPFG